MQDGFVRTRSYGRIHYLVQGAGKVLILLHSNGNSAYEYEDMMKAIGDRFHVFAIDSPGHGDSDPITRHYSVEDYAGFVIEFMDAMGIRTASFLGSSIGGAVAVELGVRHAQRLEKLFVCESPVRTPEQWRERWLATEKGYMVPIQTAEQVKPRLRNLTPEVLERWNIDRAKAGTWTMIDVMWALREYDVLSAIPRIAARTLAVYGSKSPHPLALQYFAEKLPSAARMTMADCGHFPMLDDPEGLAKVVMDFIDAA